VRCGRDVAAAAAAWAAAPPLTSRHGRAGGVSAGPAGRDFASCVAGHLLHARCFQVSERLRPRKGWGCPTGALRWGHSSLLLSKTQLPWKSSLVAARAPLPLDPPSDS
jgi:hypothetical protein